MSFMILKVLTVIWTHTWMWGVSTQRQVKFLLQERFNPTKLWKSKVAGSSEIDEDPQVNSLSSFDHVEKSPSTWQPHKLRKCNPVILANFSAANGVASFNPANVNPRILALPYNNWNAWKRGLKPSQIGTTLDASSWKSMNITNLNIYNQIRKTNPTTWYPCKPDNM